MVCVCLGNNDEPPSASHAEDSLITNCSHSLGTILDRIWRESSVCGHNYPPPPKCGGGKLHKVTSRTSAPRCVGTSVHCGVTGEPLTVYCPWATAQTSLSNSRCEVGPKLKWALTTLKTCWWVCGSPWVWALITNFLAMFCLRKLSISLSSCVSWWTLPCAVAMTVKERGKTTKGHMITPWGEECWVISSKIAEFWYYTSVPCLMYVIINYKNI